jgi:hypothetical protein
MQVTFHQCKSHSTGWSSFYSHAAGADDPLSKTITVITRIAIERADVYQRLFSAGLSKFLKSQSEKMKARRRDFGLSRAAEQW